MGRVTFARHEKRPCICESAQHREIDLGGGCVCCSDRDGLNVVINEIHRGLIARGIDQVGATHREIEDDGFQRFRERIVDRHQLEIGGGSACQDRDRAWKNGIVCASRGGSAHGVGDGQGSACGPRARNAHHRCSGVTFLHELREPRQRNARLGGVIVINDDLGFRRAGDHIPRPRSDLQEDGLGSLSRRVSVGSDVNFQHLRPGGDGEVLIALSAGHIGRAESVVRPEGGRALGGIDIDDERLRAVSCAREGELPRGQTAFVSSGHGRSETDGRRWLSIELRSIEVGCHGDAVVELLGENVAVEQRGERVGVGGKIGNREIAVVIRDHTVGSIGRDHDVRQSLTELRHAPGDRKAPPATAHRDEFPSGGGAALHIRHRAGDDVCSRRRKGAGNDGAIGFHDLVRREAKVLPRIRESVGIGIAGCGGEGHRAANGNDLRRSLQRERW